MMGSEARGVGRVFCALVSNVAPRSHVRRLRDATSFHVHGRRPSIQRRIGEPTARRGTDEKRINVVEKGSGLPFTFGSRARLLTRKTSRPEFEVQEKWWEAPRRSSSRRESKENTESESRSVESSTRPWFIVDLAALSLDLVCSPHPFRSLLSSPPSDTSADTIYLLRISSGESQHNRRDGGEAAAAAPSASPHFSSFLPLLARCRNSRACLPTRTRFPFLLFNHHTPRPPLPSSAHPSSAAAKDGTVQQE